MPSLGRTFGGNGDLIGAWFKEFRASLRCSRPLRCWAGSRRKGRTHPSSGMWVWPVLIRCRAARREKEASENSTLVGMGADTGNGSVNSKRAPALVDYDPETTANLRENSGSFPRAGSRKRSEDLGDQETHHRSPVGWRLPRRVPTVVSSITTAGVRKSGSFHCGCGCATGRRRNTPSLTIAAWAHHVADRLAQTAT